MLNQQNTTEYKNRSFSIGPDIQKQRGVTVEDNNLYISIDKPTNAADAKKWEIQAFREREFFGLRHSDLILRMLDALDRTNYPTTASSVHHGEAMIAAPTGLIPMGPFDNDTFLRKEVKGPYSYTGLQGQTFMSVPVDQPESAKPLRGELLSVKVQRNLIPFRNYKRNKEQTYIPYPSS